MNPNVVPFFSLRSSTGPSFTIIDPPVDQAPIHRDLGIIVSADLSWFHHIPKVCSSAYNTLYFVRRNVSAQPYCCISKFCIYCISILPNSYSCIAVSSGVPTVLGTSLIWRQFRGMQRDLWCLFLIV